MERKHKHLLETSKALLFQSNLLIKYWGDCVLSATYLINRLPSSVLHNLSPYEKLHGVPPTYDHLKSFGCLCYAHFSTIGRDKFQPRSITCVFIGYPCGKKRYKLLNLKTNSIFFSRDVIFHEHLFLYSHSYDVPSSPHPPDLDILPPLYSISIPLPSTTTPSLPAISPVSPIKRSFRTHTHSTPAYLFDYICIYVSKVSSLEPRTLKPQSYQQAVCHLA